MTWEGLISRVQEYYPNHVVEELQKIYQTDPARALEAARLLVEIAELRQERTRYPPGSREYTNISHRISDRRKKLLKLGLIHLDVENPTTKLQKMEQRRNGSGTAQVLVQVKKQAQEVKSITFDDIVRTVSALANYLFHSDPPPYMCVPVETIADMFDVAPRYVRDVVEDPRLDGRVLWTPVATHICIRPNVDNVLIDESKLSRQVRLLLKRRDMFMPWREIRQVLLDCLDNPVYCREDSEKSDKLLQAVKSLAIALTLLPDIAHPDAVPDIEVTDDGKLTARWTMLGIIFTVEKIGNELTYRISTEMQMV